MTTTQHTLRLSSAAYTSEHFERVFDSFRPRFAADFRFTVTPGVAGEYVNVSTNDPALAAEIIASLEDAANDSRPEGEEYVNALESETRYGVVVRWDEDTSESFVVGDDQSK